MIVVLARRKAEQLGPEFPDTKMNWSARRALGVPCAHGSTESRIYLGQGLGDGLSRLPIAAIKQRICSCDPCSRAAFSSRMIVLSVSIASGDFSRASSWTSPNTLGRPPGLPLSPLENGLPLSGIGCSSLFSAKVKKRNSVSAPRRSRFGECKELVVSEVVSADSAADCPLRKRLFRHYMETSSGRPT